MYLVTSTLLALVLVACSSDKSPAIDAGLSDAVSSVCTGQLYDACNPSSSNCMAGLTCKSFTASAFAVCTQTCGTCPNQGSTAVTCNGMGICKPSMPNACTLP